MITLFQISTFHKIICLGLSETIHFVCTLWFSISGFVQLKKCFNRYVKYVWLCASLVPPGSATVKHIVNTNSSPSDYSEKRKMANSNDWWRFISCSTHIGMFPPALKQYFFLLQVSHNSIKVDWHCMQSSWAHDLNSKAGYSIRHNAFLLVFHSCIQMHHVGIVSQGSKALH